MSCGGGPGRWPCAAGVVAAALMPPEGPRPRSVAADEMAAAIRPWLLVAFGGLHLVPGGWDERLRRAWRRRAAAAGGVALVRRAVAAGRG